MSRLPKFLQKYFWDVDFGKINLDNRRVYVLKRILEYGDETAVRWMRNSFTKAEIRDILYHYRGLSFKSANFWAFIVNVKKENVKCLKRRLSKGLMTAWPY